MAFCPNCRYEYLPEISECPDCGAHLVETLPEIHTVYENVKWVPLRPLPGVVYAKMVTEILDQKEIPNYVQSLLGSGALGVISSVSLMGAYARIFVPDVRKKEAEDVLNEIFPEEQDDSAIRLSGEQDAGLNE